MVKYTLLLLAIALVGVSLAQEPAPPVNAAINTELHVDNNQIGNEHPALDVGATLIGELFNSDLVQAKLQRLFQFIDLKIRVVRFVKAVLTRHNLALFKQFLDLVARGSSFLAQFLPDETPAELQAQATFAQSDPNGRPGFLTAVIESLFPAVGPQDPAANAVYESSVAGSTVAPPAVNVTVGRVGRDTTAEGLTADELKLVEEHGEAARQVARLIYNAKRK